MNVLQKSKKKKYNLFQRGRRRVVFHKFKYNTILSTCYIKRLTENARSTLIQPEELFTRLNSREAL